MRKENLRPKPWKGLPMILVALSLVIPWATTAGASTAVTAATAASVTTTTTTAAPTNCSQCHAGTTIQSHHSTAYFTNGECTKCHVGVTTTGDCSLCHASTLQNRHHVSAPALAGNCAQCHTNVGDYKKCLSCHEGKTRTKHHDYAKARSMPCATCHTAIVSGGCRACHVTTGNTHHEVAKARNLSCNSCHGQISGSTSGCSSCHSFKTSNVHHTTAMNPYSLSCSSCHTSTWNGSSYVTGMPTTAQCVQCHTTVVGTASIAQTHHMTIPAQTGQCSACHIGTTNVADCSTCHSQSTTVTLHHSTATYATGSCIVCHAGAESTKIVCATCHAQPRHHQTTQAVAGDCKYCHSTIQIQGTGCSSCHTQPISSIHHGTPLQNVGGNCGACHQAVSSPSVCANCHLTTNPHHSTTASITGDCTRCHKVPAAQADRPKQAACRECHGTSTHNKGGPIKDYGACAACHTTKPFHPAPRSGSGSRDGMDSRNDGPGRNKFNLFSSSRRGDEGRRSPSTKLNFNLVQISSAGQTYSVPSFDPVNSVGLAECTRCHSDNKAKVSCTNALWTSHLAKKYVTLAVYQLAESTYLGTLCGSAGGVSCTVAPTGTYLEAEHYNVFGTNFTALTGTGVNNGQYLKSLLNATSTQTGTPVSYTLKFGETGTYYLWFRGNDGRSTSANSLWYGLNGVRVGDIKTPGSDTLWRWVNARDANGPTVAAITVNTVGTHTLNIWAKEANFQLDGIYITKASTAIPGGTGVTIPTGASVISPTSCGGIVAPPPPPAPVNLALNKPATASLVQSGYEAVKAVDGNATTYWWAKSTSTHWLRVDLGSAQTISSVTVAWSPYYATSYTVQTSTDGSNWTSVASISSATGGNRNHTFTARSARYVRISCTKAASSNGYGIYELNVFK